MSADKIAIGMRRVRDTRGGGCSCARRANQAGSSDD